MTLTPLISIPLATLRLPASGPTILALGADLKHAFCLTQGSEARVYGPFGDLRELEAHENFLRTAEAVLGYFGTGPETRPEALVRDLHPDFMSTRFALDMGEQEGIPILSLQHHFAHAHAVLAEHGHRGPAVILALDGAGYGGDGTVWGGECLFVDTETLEHQRCGHLATVPLPGGDAAIREPWRMAASYLATLGNHDPILPDWRKAFPKASALLPRLLEKGILSTPTTSCGRLFDAVAALLGLKLVVEQEAEAAVLLERVQDMSETGRYECPLRPETAPVGPVDSASTVTLDTLALFQQCLEEHRAGIPVGIVSRRFHLGLAYGLAELATHACGQRKTSVVGLSGGVLLNRTLAQELPKTLAARGLLCLSHKSLPPGDPCVCLGQAAWARRLLDQKDCDETG
jgi:hydrogenase maturation protein HypF